MTATNQQMTSQQLDELMVVAVSMQRDAEKLDERPVAVFAYAVQLALSELQLTKQQHAEAGIQVVKDACSMAINLTDSVNHPANGPLPAKRIRRVIEALESSLQYRNGSSLDHFIADAIKGLRELQELRKAQ